MALHKIRTHAYIRCAALALLTGSLFACGGGSSQNNDPTVDDRPIAYVKRPVPTDQNMNPISNDYQDPSSFNPGANIYLKNNATFVAGESNVTSSLLGTTGDVKDLEFSSDGQKLVFSARLEDPNPDDDIDFTWDIYTYDLRTGVLAPVITNPAVQRLGNDVMPHFVPDGNDPAARIVFSSDRGTGVTTILNSEGKQKFKFQTDDRSVYAYNLHMIDADGTDLRQITYNMSHDFDPVMLQDGRILFVRLDNSRSGTGFANIINGGRYSLYTVHPDGTNLQQLYGFDSQGTGTNNSRAVLTSPRVFSDGRVVAILRDFTGTFDGGDVVTVDTNTYINNTVALDPLSGMTGPAQTSSFNPGTVLTNAGISSGGRYAAAVPMQDGTDRVVVSYSLCFVNVTQLDMTVTREPCSLVPDLTAANVAEAPPAYGIWIYDFSSSTQDLIRNAEVGFYFTDIALSQDLLSPAVIPNSTTGASEQAGTINIRSVYDVDGNFNELGGPAATNFYNLMETTLPENRRPRFIRIVKGVYFPNDDDIDNFDFDTAGFGGGGINYMREIIGYAPIHPDGSIRVTVPANVPLSFEVVDVNLQRINTSLIDPANMSMYSQEYAHPTWLTVRPNEEVTCHGCHGNRSRQAHGRKDPLISEMSPGAGATNLGFTNAVGVLYNGIIPFPAAVGQTMAEARTTVFPLEMSVSNSVIYDDYWTGSGNDFTLRYSNLQTVINSQNANPMNASCGDIFAPECRIVYNYERHIQPIWEVARTDINAVDKTCTNCHSPFNAAQAAPQGLYQLDLTSDHGGGVDTLSNTNYFASYNELFSNDNNVVAMGAALIDEQFMTDCAGNTLVTPAPKSVFCNDNDGDDTERVLTKGTARNSTVFFSKFRTTDAIHCPADGMGGCTPILTPDELRVITEWVDNGAQYVNDPFASPQN